MKAARLPENIAAVIFDCDGVLVDSEILGLDDCVAYLNQHGFEWTAPDVIQTFTGYRDDIFRQILEDAYQQRHGHPPDETLFTGLIEARRRHRDALQIVTGADKAAQLLQDNNIPLAVASSSRMIYLQRKLSLTGLWDIFAPHIYSAELVSHGKPAPDIFLYAAEKLNIENHQCLVIEDSAQGVKAGLAAGMTVWGFTGGGHCFEGHDQLLLDAGATCVIPDFTSLSDALKHLYDADL